MKDRLLRSAVCGFVFLFLCSIGCSHQASKEIAPFSEAPFPALTADDFAVDPEIGITLSKEYILIAFKDDTTETEAIQAILRVGGTLVGALGEARIVLVKLPTGISPKARHVIIDTLNADPVVTAATEDMPLYPNHVPQQAQGGTDQNWNWFFFNPSSTGNWGLKAIGMPIAWNLQPIIEADSDPVTGRRFTAVNVVANGFQRHTDLLPDIFSLSSGDFASDDADSLLEAPGTFLSGIIGARWDGAYVDGVSRTVRIQGTNTPDVPIPSVLLSPEATLMTISQTLQQVHLTNGLLLLPFGFNWNKQCYVRVGRDSRRCDPRQDTDARTQAGWGRWVPDSDCDASTVRRSIRRAAEQFAQDLAHSSGTVMIFTSAGNDSGPSITPGQNYCSHPDDLPSGMGNFPSLLASPMNFAANQIPDAVDKIIVAESVQATNDMRGPLTLAPSSNNGGTILAPGVRVVSLGGGGSSSSTQASFGTSIAAAHVAGVAAYLMSLNPTLDSPTLYQLLKSQSGPAVTGTPTTDRLYAPTAVENMAVLLSSSGGGNQYGNGLKLLADMDDGTQDGFLKYNYDLAGHRIPDPPRQDPIWPAKDRDRITVNIGDFRYLRDSALINEGISNSDVCPSATPACDLNGDGRVGQADFPEAYPRALIAQGSSPLLTGDSFDLSLERIQAAWDEDELQHWNPNELQKLRKSGDVIIFAEDFLACNGDGSTVKVTLKGDAPSDNPVSLSNLDPLTDISIGPQESVLTTPFTQNITMSAVVVDGRKSGQSFDNISLGSLPPGDEVGVYLNPAALDDPAAYLVTPTPGDCLVCHAPVSTSVSALTIGKFTCEPGGGGGGGENQAACDNPSWSCAIGDLGIPSAPPVSNPGGPKSYLSTPPLPIDTAAQDVLQTCGDFNDEACPLSETCKELAFNSYGCLSLDPLDPNCHYTPHDAGPYLNAHQLPMPGSTELCGYHSVYHETCYATTLSREAILQYYDCQLAVKDCHQQGWHVLWVDGGHDLIFYSNGDPESSKVLVTYDLNMYCIQTH